MSFIKQNHVVSYDIGYNITGIKAWKSGENEGVQYLPSVKFRSSNIEEVEDKDVGLREIEEILEFQIKTDDLKSAIAIVDLLRQKREAHEPIIFKGTRAKDLSQNVFRVTSVISSNEFVKINQLKNST